MAVHISSAAQWRQILSSSSIVVTDCESRCPLSAVLVSLFLPPSSFSLG